MLTGKVVADSTPAEATRQAEAESALELLVPRAGDVPAVAVVALASTVTASTVAGWMGWTVLSGRLTAAALLVAALAASGLALHLLRPTPVRASRGATVLLLLPALSVLAAAAAGLVRGVPAGITWFLNGDHPRHAVYVADTWAQGALTYAVDGYPRGWHAALAASWSVVGAGMDPAALLRLLQLMAATSLVLSALLALSMAHLGHALAQRLGRGPEASAAVGLVVGSATLLNVFLGTYQAMGYENSLLAAVVLAVCCREVLVRPGSTISLVVCGAGTVVVAHSWQLLLPAVGLTGLWCAATALRRGARLATAVVVVTVGVVLVVGSPAVLAVVQGVGLGHATEAGPDSPVPWALLLVGSACALVLGVRAKDGATRTVAGVTVVPALAAVALSVALGLDLLQYYPSKLLWQSALLALPWIAVAAANGVVVLSRRGAEARSAVRGVGYAVVGVFAAYALLLPFGSQVGIWSTVDGARVVGAVGTPGAGDAAVVWLQGSRTTDAVTRSLLDVLRVDQTRARAPQSGLTVAQECDLLRAADQPAVLSTASSEEVRRRYGCVPDVRLVPVAVVDR